MGGDDAHGVLITFTACAGDGHVLAVAAEGRLWGWGKNEAGQLGLGSCSAWQSVPADITAALDGAWKVCVVRLSLLTVLSAATKAIEPGTCMCTTISLQHCTGCVSC